MGRIKFEPIDVTKKHVLQSDWKKIAMIIIDGDICEYYAWFLKKRYRILLNKPLRNSHVSFINEKSLDITGDWEDIKGKWNNKKVDITLSLDVRTNAKHWWLNLPEEHNKRLTEIRDSLGLSKPFYPFHLSLGYCNELNIKHSEYIHNLIKKDLTNEE